MKLLILLKNQDYNSVEQESCVEFDTTELLPCTQTVENESEARKAPSFS